MFMILTISKIFLIALLPIVQFKPLMDAPNVIACQANSMISELIVT